MRGRIKIFLFIGGLVAFSLEANATQVTPDIGIDVDVGYEFNLLFQKVDCPILVDLKADDLSRPVEFQYPDYSEEYLVVYHPAQEVEHYPLRLYEHRIRNVNQKHFTLQTNAKDGSLITFTYKYTISELSNWGHLGTNYYRQPSHRLHLDKICTSTV